MKQLFCYFVSLVLVLGVYEPLASQGLGNVKVTWGAPIKFPKNYYPRQVVKTDRKSYDFMLDDLSNPKGWTIFTTDDLLVGPSSEVHGAIVNVSTEKNAAICWEGFYKMSGRKHYLFFSIPSTTKEESNLYVRTLDPLSLDCGPINLLINSSELSGTITMDEIPDVGYYPFILTNKYTFTFSSDSSKLLIKYKLKAARKMDKSNYDVYGLYVYDANMTKLWGREFKMPYSEATMSVIGETITRKGSAYLLVKVYEGNKTEMVSGKPNYRLELWAYNKDSENPKIYPISTGDYFVGNKVCLYEDTKEGINILGAYSSNYSNSNSRTMDGIFQVKIDEKTAKGAIPIKIWYEFVNEELAKYNLSEYKKLQAKGASALDLKTNNLKMEKPIPSSDGGYFLIGEEYEAYPGEYRMNYDYAEIHIVKMDKAGKMVWHSKVPKFQNGVLSPGGKSFALIVKNDELYFFFTDNPKNVEMATDKDYMPFTDGRPGYKDCRPGMLFCAKVDRQGKMGRYALMDLKKETVDNVFYSRMVPTDRSTVMGIVLAKKYGNRPLIISVE